MARGGCTAARWGPHAAKRSWECRGDVEFGAKGQKEREDGKTRETVSLARGGRTESANGEHYPCQPRADNMFIKCNK
jgi:hypothetical protein